MSNKLEQVAVRLEPELREKLQLAADRDRRPLAGMIRKILHDATKPAAETGAQAA
jgi:predicted DNA-binding protein